MSKLFLFLFTAVFGLVVGIATPRVFAQDTVCARVVIQIDQELTLEREGFEARLGISNGQPSSLDDFQVVLNFTDANGNPVTAATDAAPDSTGKFYYRVQTGYTLPTSIDAGVSKTVAYLIVPAPGAAGTTSDGSLYYVGATIKYKVAGVQQTVDVTPDFIRVRPMPDLQLQYFLPGDVYGDDPLTPDVQEPVVPFVLGVRVTNHSSFVAAHQVTIQSGQPEIVDNQRGLLIDFRIVAAQVNGSVAAPSLLANFGDIAAQRSAVGNWLMTASLSGKFIKFTAEVSHAPEFGGALTSLIPEDAISTHRLLGQVIVDLPGRDSVPDFLATDDMTGNVTSAKIYESDSDQVSTTVTFLPPDSPAVNLTPAGSSYLLSTSVVADLLYLQRTSPVPSDKVIRAVRSDGKILLAANCWMSKSKDDSGHWLYWVNLFDTTKLASATYTLTFSDRPADNSPPVLQFPSGRYYQVVPGTLLSIPVNGTDPDGLIPTLSTGDLPDGAAFIDAKDGHGTFTWTPNLGQLGSYTVLFRASDGMATDTKTIQILVTSNPLSGFGSWQQRYWPGVNDVNIIGPNADPDGDQISNLLEYALDADPTAADESVLPEISAETVSGSQYLALTYRKRTDDATLVYEVVASDDLDAPLSTWAVQTQSISVEQTGLSAGITRVKIRDSLPIETGSGHRYLRLRVTQISN